jgi:hypothetical protein
MERTGMLLLSTSLVDCLFVLLFQCESVAHIGFWGLNGDDDAQASCLDAHFFRLI